VRTLAVIASLAALPAAVAYAAITDNMMPTYNYDRGCLRDFSTVCQTDSAALNIYRESTLTTTGMQNIRATLDDSYNTTDLNVTYPSTPQYSGTGQTDIIYRQNTSRMPANADGFTWCDAVGSTYVACDQQYIDFRSSTPSISLACHETGHAVGLLHGAQAGPALDNQDSRLACMTTPVASRWLGSQNVEMINGTY